MQFDLDYLANYDNQVSSVDQEIRNHYNSEWNDDVHESFYGFVSFFQEHLNSVSELMNSMSDILGKLEFVNSKDLNTVLTGLSEEAARY